MLSISVILGGVRVGGGAGWAGGGAYGSLT